jgi:hypothetical protein
MTDRAMRRLLRDIVAGKETTGDTTTRGLFRAGEIALQG